MTIEQLAIKYFTEGSEQWNELIADIKAYNQQLSYDSIMVNLVPDLNTAAGKLLSNCYWNNDESKTKGFVDIKKIIGDTGLNLIGVGVTVERMEYELRVNPYKPYVTAEEYKKFAECINWAAQRGFIEHGVLTEPFRMAMAVISPSRRYMLLFYTFSRLSVRQLKQISNLFVSEGELPSMLGQIQLG